MMDKQITQLLFDKEAPVFIIAEMSGNHKQSFEEAKKIVEAAAWAGADAIKLQTYTADTITLNCNNDYFKTIDGSLWSGRTLYDLYQEAYTPWEWQPELKVYAESLGLVCFSSPFDLTSVDFLEKMNVPCYKIASFEINDIQLIKYTASKGKPIIMSTGVATLGEINEAIQACKEVGNEHIIVLKCTSAYPTPMEEVNLLTMPNMAETFGVTVGLSDHTLGSSVAIAAIALGARVVEKHLTLCRADGGVDDAFSMEPKEFKQMVTDIRQVEKALGKVTYELSDKQKESTVHKRSLFVSADIKAGEVFTQEHIKSVRPVYGMPTKYFDQVIGKRARTDLKIGTPLTLASIEESIE